MLNPDQIERLGNSVQVLIDPVTDWLIKEIARRISKAGQLTSTAAYEVWKLQTLGKSQEDIKKRLALKLNVSREEIEKLLAQSAEVGYNFDVGNFPDAQAIPFKDNRVLQDIVSAAVAVTDGNLLNITGTTALGFTTYDGKFHLMEEAIQKSCDFAFTKVATGAQDYNAAVREATRGLADKGIQTLDYESGIHTELGAAIRRNVMGGLGIMQENISQSVHDELGADGWEISAHFASAPDHEPIQGRQYTDAEYQALNNSLVRRIGTLNCGHSAYPINIGISPPKYSEARLEEMRMANEKGITYEGQHYTTYEATQRQRALERAIRKQKRRAAVAEATGDKERLSRYNTRLTVLSAEYERFSAAAGLVEQWERTWIA